jgi:hypothetical protein
MITFTRLLAATVQMRLRVVGGTVDFGLGSTFAGTASSPTIHPPFINGGRGLHTPTQGVGMTHQQV